MSLGSALPVADQPANPRRLLGTLLHGERLAGYTSWRVGGPADRLYLPADAEDLIAHLATVPPGEAVFWLGLGSNLLVRDGGIRGFVICTKGRLKRLLRLDGERILAESGVACAHVARFCSELGWEGAEFLAGIPGTIGGALAMNAGAFGTEIWSLVERVRTVNRYGLVSWRDRSAFSVGYRTVSGLNPDEWFVGAELRLERGDAARSRRRIRELLARRADSQPTNMPSCGSVFRNPIGDHAGRLIESSGLKGFRIGGAEVSQKHANFIINTGEASATDIEALIQHVQAQVWQRHGVMLQPEVRIVGEAMQTGDLGHV